MRVVQRMVASLALVLFLAGAAYAQDPRLANESEAFLDRGTIMAGCGVGIAWGAVSLATYPIWKWAKDAGAILSMGVMAWRSVLGCYYGILGGVVVSGASSTWRMAEDAFTPDAAEQDQAATGAFW